MWFLSLKKNYSRSECGLSQNPTVSDISESGPLVVYIAGKKQGLKENHDFPGYQK